MSIILACKIVKIALCVAASIMLLRSYSQIAKHIDDDKEIELNACRGIVIVAIVSIAAILATEML